MAKRICSICGAEMADGYCYGDGLKYYCSEDCLHHDFTDEEWEEVYEADEGYYTEWYDESFWSVRAVSDCGVVTHIIYCETEEAAKAYCEERNYKIWHPEENTIWKLEIAPPCDD